MARDVVDVAARGDPDAAHLRCKGVGKVVAVQVERRDHVEIRGACQDLLERDVGDRVLDHDPGAWLALGNPAPWPSVDLDGAKEVLRDLVSPVAKGPLGELHDVSLMDKGDTLSIVPDRVADRRVHQPDASRVAHGLDPDSHLYFGRETLRAHFIPE